MQGTFGIFSELQRLRSAFSLQFIPLPSSVTFVPLSSQHSFSFWLLARAMAYFRSAPTFSDVLPRSSANLRAPRDTTNQVFSRLLVGEVTAPQALAGAALQYSDR